MLQRELQPLLTKKRCLVPGPAVQLHRGERGLDLGLGVGLDVEERRRGGFGQQSCAVEHCLKLFYSVDKRYSLVEPFDELVFFNQWPVL